MSMIGQLAGTAEAPVAVARQPSTHAGVRVLPYNASLDVNADKFLPWLWHRLKEDDLIDLYFPGSGAEGFSDFVKLMSGGANVLLVTVHNEEGEVNDAMGFATWTPAPIGQLNSAITGFIFLRKYWDGATTRDAAEVIMRYWFDQAGIDSLIGVVAEANTPARAFLKRLDWKMTGIIPGAGLYHNQQCDAELWTLNKAMWLEREVR